MGNTFARTFGVLAAVAALLVSTASYGHGPSKERRSTPSTDEANLGYVVMDGSNTIAIVDIDAQEIVGRIAVAGDPHGGTLTPDGRYIYAASMGSTEIYVVDTEARAVTKTVEIGSISHHSAITADGRFLYLAADQVVVIDTSTNRVVARVDAQGMPFDLSFTPDGRLLYVLNMGSTISVIDPATNKVVDSIEMHAQTMMGHLAFSLDGQRLYVTHDVAGTVSVIDVPRNEKVATVKVGQGPHGVAVTHDGRYVYVANRGEGTFSVIDADTNAVIATKEVGERPEHVALTPDGGYVFMGINTGADRLLVIDPDTFETIKEIPGWPAAHTLLFPPPT